MTCPFLRESQVKYCQAACVRKLIPLGAVGLGAAPPGDLAVEKCTSAEFSACTIFRNQHLEAAAVDRCPSLQEALMQYCAGAPVAKLVPYTESVLSRCGNGSYRYCDIYLRMAHPEQSEEDVDGVRIPSWLQYSGNHMWIDAAEKGVCHVGIDGFLARFLGPVERISFVWTRGHHRPSAVLSAQGVELQVVFPNPLLITGCNLYLRADPGRVTSDPYSAGWLFEGTLLTESLDGLQPADDAREWMRREHGRMNEFVHEQFCRETGERLSADGGVFSPDLIRTLSREQILGVFHEFFSPMARLKRES